VPPSSSAPTYGSLLHRRPLEAEIGEPRGYNSVLLDSYGRLADFFVSKSTTEENYLFECLVFGFSSN